MSGDLYVFLRSQFTDLASAKRFAWRWCNQMSQELPDFGGCSMRAMAAHISHVLEGTEPASGLTNFVATRHGVTIYHAMCAPTEDDAAVSG